MSALISLQYFDHKFGLILWHRNYLLLCLTKCGGLDNVINRNLDIFVEIQIVESIFYGYVNFRQRWLQIYYNNTSLNKTEWLQILKFKSRKGTKCIIYTLYHLFPSK